MISALDVARYIIRYSNEQNYSTSNLRLQKLLYFVQAYYLAFTPSHEPCFREEIEAWDFGPVVPSVYCKFRSFGGSNIPPDTNCYSLNDKDNFWSVREVPYDSDCISKRDKKLINDIVDKFRAYSTSELVKLTHNQAPWRKSYIPGHHAIITKETIRDYFNGES